MNALTVRPLDALARRINEEQFQIEHHAKGMLLCAKSAGAALIDAKKQLAHGQFKAWVEANTRVSYRQAAAYMRVAKLSKDADLRTFDGGIDAFLDQFAQERPQPPSNLPTFTEDDAEYALKIAARMGSDFQGERDVAASKLANLAEQHGMTSEELVEKSKKLCPDDHLSSYEAEKQRMKAELKETRDKLQEIEEKIEAVRIHIIKEYATATREDLIDVIAYLTVQLAT